MTGPAFQRIRVVDSHTGGEPTRLVWEGGPDLGCGPLEDRAQGFPEVDHVKLCAPSPVPGVHSRNFVLCPGLAYDRSPCGTGTSARLACLAADGKLAEGAEWVQESIVGSLFRGKFRRDGDKIIPTISGTAHVTGEGVLLLDPADPFRWGVR